MVMFHSVAMLVYQRVSLIHSETQIIHTILQSYPNLTSNQFPVGGGLFGYFFFSGEFFFGSSSLIFAAFRNYRTLVFTWYLQDFAILMFVG